MRKPDYTENQKQIMAKRLTSIMEEKGVTQADLVKHLLNITCTDYESKFPKYVRGQLSMPKHIIPYVADRLQIDPAFFTDVSSFPDSFFSCDYSYDGYLKYKNFENIYSDDFYKKYSAILSVFGYKLGVRDETYEVYEGTAITSDYCLQLSREELFALVEEVKASGHDLIRSRMKGGDADDLT